MTFPSGVAKMTVTGQNIVDSGGNPLQGVVVFDMGTPEFSSGATPPTVFENPVMAEVRSGVMDTITIPDSVHAFAAPFTYVITVRFEGRDEIRYPGIVISIDTYASGTVDIAQLLL